MEKATMGNPYVAFGFKNGNELLYNSCFFCLIAIFFCFEFIQYVL